MKRTLRLLIILVLISNNLKSQTKGNWYTRAGHQTFYISNGTSGDFNQTIGFSIAGTLYVGNKSFFARYDSKLDTYIPMATPTFISNVVASFAIGEKGYVLAKLSSGLVSMYEYNPNTNQWLSKQQFTGNAITAAACFVINNKAYIVSGNTLAWNSNNSNGNYSSQVWEYNPSTDVLLRKRDSPFFGSLNIINPSMQKPRGFASGNYGYVLFNSSTFYQYDPITDNWYQKPAPNTGYSCQSGVDCYYFNALSYKGYVYYLVQNFSTTTNSKLMRYDPALETWEIIESRTASSTSWGAAIESQLWIEDTNFVYGLGFGTNTSWTPNDYVLYTSEVNPVCVNSTNNFDFQLKFTAKGDFITGNTFKLLLSDESGNFNNPTVLDNISTNTSAQYIGTFTKSFGPALWDEQKNYRLKVTASNPSTEDMFETPIKSKVKYYPSVIVSSSGSTNICQGSSVTLSVPSVTGNTYQWFKNGIIINGVTTNSYSVSSAGNYSVTVNNTNGCSATSTATAVTVNPLPTASITASGPTTFCQGGNVVLTASTGSGYLWSNGATTQSITVSSSGNYTVTITNANGCAATSTAMPVTVNPLPTANITASGPTSLCQGGSVILTATTASSYLWSNGATTQSITANSAGNYSVRTTNASGCSNTSPNTTITVNSLPTTPTITASGPTTFCQGGNVVLTASTANSYLWSNGATTQSITVSSSGNYAVSVTNANGCAATSTAIPVTVSPLPTANITINGPTTFCQGGNVVLTANNASSYLWSNGATTQSITVSNSGNYSVTVTNASGCSATSSTIPVIVNPLPTANITANGSTNICEGATLVLTANSGSSYLWNNGATTQSITVNNGGNYNVRVTNASGCSATSTTTTVTVKIFPPANIGASGPTTFCQGGNVVLTASTGSSYLWSNGATTQSITVSSSGNYSVIITNANGCAATSPTMPVTVNPLPTANITASGPTTLCQGGSVILTATTASSYLWSNGATTQSITVNSAGNYSVRTTNANGCSITSTITPVTVNALPTTPTITAGGPTTFCQGGNVVLTSSTANSYLWSNGATTQSITVNNSGNYSVTVINTSGCTATSTAIPIIVNPLPTANITANGPTTFCQSGNVVLTASTGSSYLWSNGATTQSITVSSSGNYSVTVTNASGCSATSSTISVIVNPLPTASITPNGATTITQTGTVILNAVVGTNYSYQWYKDGLAISSANLNSYTANTGGSYAVKITNSTGCSTISSPIEVKSVLLLSSNNFQVRLQGETCRISNNGNIIISAMQVMNYTATLTKSGQILKTATFTTNTELTGLSAGNYTLCITVAGQPNYKQCYDLVITEPQDLAVYSYVDRNSNSLTLTMTGSDSYNVSINDRSYTSKSTNINLSLKKGWNKIKVSTEKECQGVYKEEVYVDERVNVYPNPFNSILNIKLENYENKEVPIKILDQSGQTVYNAKNKVNDGLVSINLSELKNGYYYVIIGPNTYKVIKK